MGKYLNMDRCLGAVSREDWFLLSKSENSASVEIAECASGVIAEEILHAINSHDELVEEVDLLRDMVIRMQTYLDMAGEYPEKESDNPVRQWLFDAIDCTK